MDVLVNHRQTDHDGVMAFDGLGDYVRYARLQRGWTQADLGERIGVDRAYISQIETGARKWPRELIPALSRVLGITQIDMARAAGLIDDGPSVAEARPTYDETAERLSRIVADWTPRQKRLLWSYIEAVDTALDDDDDQPEPTAHAS